MNPKSKNKIQEMQPEFFYSIFLWWHSSLRQVARGDRPGLAFLAFMMTMITMTGGIALILALAIVIFALMLFALSLITTAL